MTVHEGWAAPQVTEHAAEREYGDDEQLRAGVLAERADHPGGQPTGERREPAGIGADRRKDTVAAADGDHGGEQRECGG
ncbi:MAG TPA: hypothetical protein VIJ33_10680, partial [Solirubrobacteraceae bacterium]